MILENQGGPVILEETRLREGNRMESSDHLVLVPDHYVHRWCYLVVEQLVWFYAMVEVVGASPFPWLQHIRHRPIYIYTK